MESRLVSLADSLRSSSTIDHFWDRINLELASCGVEGLLYAAAASKNEVDVEHMTQSVIIKTNYGSEYLDYFGQDELLNNDFTAEQVFLNEEVIVWHDESVFENASQAQRSQAYIERDMGLHVGVSISASLINPRSVGGIGLNMPSTSVKSFSAEWRHYSGFVMQILSLLDLGMREQFISQSIALSPREKETLQWLSAGCHTSEVAKKMHIGYRTVDKYIVSAKNKLGARTRDQAVARALIFNII